MCRDETLGDGTLWRCCWERHHQPVSLWSSVVRCMCTCVLGVTKVWGGLATGSQVCLPHATVVTLVCVLWGWPEAHRCPSGAAAVKMVCNGRPQAHRCSPSSAAVVT